MKFQEFLWIDSIFSHEYLYIYLSIFLLFSTISFVSMRSKKMENRFSSSITQIMYFVINSLSFPFAVFGAAFLQDVDQIPSNKAYLIDKIDGFSLVYGNLTFMIIGMILFSIVYFFSGKVFVLKNRPIPS